MKYARAVFLIALLACTAAVAQGGNPYNGDWTATWQGTKDKKHQNVANVVILENGGTFQNLHSAKNPCVGRKAPINVTTATADELIFVIEFSTVLRGCKDSEVKLKRVDDKTLKGLRDENKEITLIKE